MQQKFAQVISFFKPIYILGWSERKICLSFFHNSAENLHMGEYNCHAKFEEIYQTSSGAPAVWKIRCEISILSYVL